MPKKTGTKTGLILVDGPRGGKLRRGGPNPNGGRKPSAIKALALQGLAEALPNITAMAKQADSDGVAAFNALAKVSGVDGRVSAADIRQRLTTQVEIIRTRASWTPDELLTALGEVWR